MPPSADPPNQSDPLTAIILVDHGSRRAASNEQLLAVVEAYRQQTRWPIVEPAHMELAEPSIATAFDRCVAQGARRVVVFPYFLSPGRHWSQDIPRLATAAAEIHPGVSHVVTAPLGLHELLLQVIDQRVAHCLAHVAGDAPACEICDAHSGCRPGNG
jgi:sirohydrochlorin ferrochelatase